MQSQHTAVVSKRPAIEFDGREAPNSKRRKEEESQVEEITLEDSDEEQDKAVRVNAATREPGPSQGPRHQAGHHSSSNTCLTQTQTPAALARLKSLPITVVGEVALSASGTDSEDDIQVTQKDVKLKLSLSCLGFGTTTGGREEGGGPWKDVS